MYIQSSLVIFFERCSNSSGEKNQQGNDLSETEINYTIFISFNYYSKNKVTVFIELNRQKYTAYKKREIRSSRKEY